MTHEPCGWEEHLVQEAAESLLVRQVLEFQVCPRDLRSGNFFPVVRDLITLGERWETIFRTLVKRFYRQSLRKSPFSFFDARAGFQGVCGRYSFDI